jgi:RHS repeat-associated protein
VHTAPGLLEPSVRVFLELGDHLGSSSVVLDRATGELVQRSTAYAYGAPESQYRPGRWKEFREDYRFTGKEDDIEVGLIYFGARYLHPLLNRWISPDPLAVHAPGKADLNLYAYVHGRVLVAVDPVGLESSQGASGGDPPPPDPPQKGVIVLAEVQVYGRVAPTEPKPAPGTHGTEGTSGTSDVQQPRGGGAIPNPVRAAARAWNGVFENARPIQPGVGDRIGPEGGKLIVELGLGLAIQRVLRGAGRALESQEATNTQSASKATSAARAGPGAAKALPPRRQQYVEAVQGLAGKVPGMREAGMSSEQIARALHAERNALKVQFRGMSPAEEVARFEARNLQKYGDKLGPSIEQLVERGKTWEQIIESATRPGGKDLGF